jgi:hypothetical protein
VLVVAGVSAVVGITVVSAYTAVAGFTTFDGIPAVKNYVYSIITHTKPLNVC